MSAALALLNAAMQAAPISGRELLEDTNTEAPTDLTAMLFTPSDDERCDDGLFLPGPEKVRSASVPRVTRLLLPSIASGPLAELP